MHVITYTRERDGVLFHGTISDLDGSPRSTWSSDHGGKRDTYEQPIDSPTFRKLWNGVGKLDVFRRHRVRDPDREMDWKNNHAIVVTFGDKDNPRTQGFVVPADEADPEFRDWLTALNIPDAKAPVKPQAATAANPNASRRQKVYGKFFGEKARWFADEDPEGPPIGVYVIEPGQDGRGHERDFYTLVTDGMSDARMRVPRDVEFRRAELVLYAAEPADQYIEMLRWLARLPHIQEGTWYGPGTTMTNGQPPRPIFDDSVLDCYLFLRSPVGRDDRLYEKLVIDGDPVVLLWVVPITNAECQLILEEDLSDFLELLDRKKHPFVLDEGRRSYVRGKK